VVAPSLFAEHVTTFMRGCQPHDGYTRREGPVSDKELERVFESICVVGAGRVGQAAAARLGERVPTRTTGRELGCAGADLVLVCVPDRAIATVAAALPPGPWIAHTSGATGLAALEPHRRRFALHPLQTFQPGLGPGQFDGAYGAVSADTPAGIDAGFALAGLLGLRGFELADEQRPPYHAAATIAASFLVTLQRAASDLMEAADAPPEALEPLMLRTIENGFQPTGPFVRGDRGTVDSHRQAIRSRRPHLTPLYDALADATETLAVR
jgi:predicted short-subunit dehydrogenase-like oxidoreductase (DUF2520 family)